MSQQREAKLTHEWEFIDSSLTHCFAYESSLKSGNWVGWFSFHHYLGMF